MNDNFKVTGVTRTAQVDVDYKCERNTTRVLLKGDSTTKDIKLNIIENMESYNLSKRETEN